MTTRSRSKKTEVAADAEPASVENADAPDGFFDTGPYAPYSGVWTCESDDDPGGQCSCGSMSVANALWYTGVLLAIIALVFYVFYLGQK